MLVPIFFPSGVARITRLAVRDYVRSQHLTVPVSVDALVRQAGLLIVEAPLRFGLQASLTLLTDPGLIFVNDQLGPFTQRFALAHELIHYWFHHAYPLQDFYASPSGHLWETEANAGAAELVLPYDWFMDTAREILGQPLRRPQELAHFLTSPAARHWAGQARVTLPVLSYHLQDLGWGAYASAFPDQGTDED